MTEASQARTIPAPLLNPEVQAYFDAAAQGRLLYRHCDACGLANHPPRTMCPHCHSGATAWRTSAGRGTVYASSMLRRGTPVPYCITYVTLDEGVTVMSNLVGFGAVTPAPGTRVKVRFVQADGGTMVPMFGPEETP